MVGLAGGGEEKRVSEWREGEGEDVMGQALEEECEKEADLQGPQAKRQEE